MSSHVHIGLYDALREAGASEKTARAGAVDIPVGQNLATKEDLLQAIAGVNDRIAGSNDRIAEVKVELANEFKALYRYLWLGGVGIVGVIFTLNKLFP